jgi:hypothetical protein
LLSFVIICYHIPKSDDNKNDDSNPFAVAISGWVAINDTGIKAARITGSASIVLPMNEVARLLKKEPKK